MNAYKAVLQDGDSSTQRFTEYFCSSCVSLALPAYQRRKEITFGNEDSTYTSNLRGKVFVTASFSSSIENTKQVAALEYIAAKPAN